MSKNINFVVDENCKKVSIVRKNRLVTILMVGVMLLLYAMAVIPLFGLIASIFSLDIGGIVFMILALSLTINMLFVVEYSVFFLFVGKEEIEVDEDMIIVKRRCLFFPYNSKYLLKELRALKFSKPAINFIDIILPVSKMTGWIQFNCKLNRGCFCSAIDENEAKEIVEFIGLSEVIR